MDDYIGLRVSLPGDPRGIEAATGHPVGSPRGTADLAIAYLPHSCDEWVIGEGSPAEVITSLRLLRDEIDHAITLLTSDGAQ